MDMWLHLEHSMKIKWHALHNASSSCATWQNLSAPSSIVRIGPNAQECEAKRRREGKGEKSPSPLPHTHERTCTREEGRRGKQGREAHERG